MDSLPAASAEQVAAPCNQEFDPELFPLAKPTSWRIRSWDEEYAAAEYALRKSQSPPVSPLTAVAEVLRKSATREIPDFRKGEAHTFRDAHLEPAIRLHEWVWSLTDLADIQEALRDRDFLSTMLALQFDHPQVQQEIEGKLHSAVTALAKWHGRYNGTLYKELFDLVDRYGNLTKVYKKVLTQTLPQDAGDFVYSFKCIQGDLAACADHMDRVQAEMEKRWRILGEVERMKQKPVIHGANDATKQQPSPKKRETRGRPRVPLEESSLAKRLYNRKMELGRKHRDRLISEYTFDVTEHLSKRARGRQKDQYTSEEVWNEIARLCELARGRHRRLNKK